MPLQRTAIFLMMILMTGCGTRCGGKAESVLSAKGWPVSVINAGFPLRLSEIDLSKAESSAVEDSIETRIRQTVDDYYTHSCNADSLHTPADVYVNTLRLSDSLQTVFLVLLRHYPTSNLDSRILFYNNSTKAFVGDAIDFKIYSLYDLTKGELKPSYLKEMLKMDGPDLEQIDYNEDGIMDYRVTRLFHNGTFNAIRTCVLSAKGGRIDTLYFKEKPFSLTP